MTAPHRAFPLFTNLGGKTLTHPRVVSVTYASHPLAKTIDAFNDWMVASSWLVDVAKDWGFVDAQHTGHVVLQEQSPAFLEQQDFEASIAQKIDAGALPAPAPDTVYAYYLPAGSIITEYQGPKKNVGCTDFLGWHELGKATVNGKAYEFQYTLMLTCPALTPKLTDEEALEWGGSHELVESIANADPFGAPAWNMPTNDVASLPWAFLGEVGDQCEFSPLYRQGSFVATRSWSNTAAKAGDDPCQPTAQGEVYFNVSPDVPAGPIAAGQSIDVMLTGWSSAPAPAWSLQAASKGDLQASVSLSASTLQNGEHATLHVSAPGNAASQSSATIYVVSKAANGARTTVWPLFFWVP